MARRKTQLVTRELLDKEFLNKEELEEELNEFAKFAFKKNMVELTIAVILGAAFNDVVKGLSEHILMPVINMILSHTGESWRDFTWEATPNMTFELGEFFGVFLDFLVTATVLYIVFVKVAKPMWTAVSKKKDKSKTKVPIIVPTEASEPLTDAEEDK